MKHWLLLSISVLLAACSNDLSDNGGGQDKTPIQVSFTLATAANSGNSWIYVAGENNENIQDGFSVLVDAQSMKVEHVLQCSVKNDDRKQEHMVTASGANLVETTVGAKLMYSFANLTQTQVEDALHKVNGLEDFKFEKYAVVDTAKINQATLAVSADGFTPSKTQGIPMTGKTSFMLTPNDNGALRTFYVVRMMGKLEFQFINDMDEELTVESVTIDQLGDNPTDGHENLMLFPAPLTPTEANGANTTIMPNLTTYGNTLTSSHTYTINQTLQAGNMASFTTYVNETNMPHTAYDCFMLTVKLKHANGTEEQRYALLSNDNDDWNFIARNDWRRIPIRLQDYTVEIIPQDFPPIGVLPCSTKKDGDAFTCYFHTFGDFHLVPRLTNRSTGEVVKQWDTDEVAWETIDDNAKLYDTAPEWYELGNYVHGTFKRGATGTSRHILTLRVTPKDKDGVTARTFLIPVTIDKDEK